MIAREAGDGRGSSARRSPVAVLAACVTLALGGGVAIGCDGGDEEPTAAAAETTTTEETPPQETDAIEISDFKFDPGTVAADAGAEISWTNGDQAPHTATADDSSFDTGTLDRGDDATVKFDEPGTYSYYCRFHPFMKGTVEVS